MPVQPHTRHREPYLTASAGWRWPRLGPDEPTADAREPEQEPGHQRERTVATIV